MIHTEKERKAIDVREIFALLLKRKWLIIIPLILVTAVAYGGSFLLTPLYQSSTIIWIDKPHNVSRELTNIIGGDVRQRTSSADRRRQLQALQNEITSQKYLFQLIRDLGLDNNPDVTLKAAEMRQTNSEQSLEKLKYHLLLEKLRSRISVTFVGADQIEISIESEDPTGARDKVTRLTEILEQEKTKYELEKILDNQVFADLQLQRTEHEYRMALDSLTAAKTHLITLQLPENISSQENRREILSDIDKTKLDISDYSDEIKSLKRNLTGFDLQQARIKYTDSLVELRAEIDGQMSTFTSLMEKYAWNEQNITNVNIRLNNNVRFLEDEISLCVDAQYASYPENQRQLLRRYFIVKENLDILNSRKSQLQLSLDRIDERISYLPKREADIAELERRVEDARRYRDAFRSEETTVEILSERAKDRTKYKIIEPASIPLAPFWPDKKKIIVMGFLLGLVIGGAAVFLVEIMDNSFKRVEDVLDVLQLPVLATIPRIERLPRSR
ncbi:MAG: Wzz/FepE/Etk N-terminal domain-containing protein [candidate division Zixibacteria bacterium]|nr:Wzz/FepE/Etk N-terminal domain-containing protein [candidate division Zixibacteria bacterium]